MNLTFDSDKHEYRLDGAAVPSVTQVLAPLYSLDSIPRDVLERKRQIGVALDAIIELDLADDLDESTIDEQLGGYFEAWQRFRQEKKFKPVWTQKRVASPKYRYAGTPDAWGTMEDHRALVDWKATYAMHPAVALQTAGYENAVYESFPNIDRNLKRYGVRFCPDGKYDITPYESKQDWATFLSLLSIFNWKKRNGLS